MLNVLSGALHLWEVAGRVQRDAEQPGGFIVAAGDGTELRIVPRAPHGWLVLRGRAAHGETLGVHAGVPGLLRQLREELAPHAKVGRLIIGEQSLL